MKNRRSIPRWQYGVLIFFVLAALILRFSGTHDNVTRILLDNRPLDVAVARTPAEQYRGLGGRDTMGKIDGMLFLFGHTGRIGIVMRAMNFPIDIVWLDGNRVVDIVSGAPIEPDSSEAELTPYYPRVDANMVLELPAGYAREYGLEIGAIMSLPETAL